ncbi:MAG: hypothetical protein A3I33_02065 [Candidatus Colwellbacteria bacterium RIFCSPLOWO2_02_FULL_45_11]|uniref:Type II secretion system protein GspG C-terminal domain-containing protein n=1 Tax=Candidatus Colwellbacteria bacterium RIFCSPLOWO2_02_FULL_45_11 TaxID=1797692 RepID=A0A1G1Z7E8_9BACT|nr:MAG: hypothetical protein A3I33_02065 [Candidatus Colwellbacteria bacterium RIFCSPLOWO2_02_FULL_45_11]
MTRKLNQFNKSGNHGFTLIEMLIVIAVIAILAGVVLTGVSGFQASARDTRRIGDLRTTQNYLELFFNKCGHYPVDGTTCGGAISTEKNSVAWSEIETALKTVTSQVPTDPVGNGAYIYEYGYWDNGLGYELQATLERDNSILDNDINPKVLSCNESETAREFCVQS